MHGVKIWCLTEQLIKYLEIKLIHKDNAKLNEE